MPRQSDPGPPPEPGLPVPLCCGAREGPPGLELQELTGRGRGEPQGSQSERRNSGDACGQ